MSRFSLNFPSESPNSVELNSVYAPTMKPNDHFRLLSLPREIRNAIYIATIHAPRDTPNSPDEAGPRYKTRCSTIWNRSVYYPIGPSSWPSHVSLIQCNRQVRSETLEILNRERRRSTCRLDCMLERLALWPTWISYPGLPQTIDHLEMNLRLFDVRDGRNLLWGRRGPGAMFVPLFWMLNHFIHHGPQFIYTGPLRHTPRLETLMIHISYEDRTRSGRELSDHRQSAQRRTVDKREIFRTFAGIVNMLACNGVLAGKIERIGVRWEDHVSIVETGLFKPSEEVGEDWERFGFRWGCDPSLTPGPDGWK